MNNAMTELVDLIRLQAWLSPAFPTGAFSFSSGLEAAAEAGLIIGEEDLYQWLVDQLKQGSIWNDAVLFSESARRASCGEALEEVCDLALALCMSSTRLEETTAQGDAFLKAAKAWGLSLSFPGRCPLPVAVGGVCGMHGTERLAAMTAFLHATVSNQIQAALRLLKVGQQGGVRILARLEPTILEVAEHAATSSLEDLGSSAMIADIISMQHETLESRIFQS